MEVQCRVGEVLYRMKQGENLLKVGAVRFDDYAYEVTGLKRRAALELVWLHQALPRYPGVEQAWREGRIYWSHVQLLLRHVKPEEEAVWVKRAETLTVRALLEMLTGDRPVTDVDVRSGFWFQVAASPQVRAEWQKAVEIGRRVAGANIQPWEWLDMAIAELLAGPLLQPGTDVVGDETVDLEGWRQWLRDEARKAREDMEAVREEEACGWADLPSEMPACEVPPVPGPDADAFQLDAYLRDLMRWSARKERAMVEGLGRFDRQGLAREFNFVDVEHYAAERLGMGRSQVADILYIYRRLPFQPGVAASFEEGNLSRTQVRMLLRVVTPASEAEWIAYAEQVSMLELSRAVEKGVLMRNEYPSEVVLPPEVEPVQTSARKADEAEARASEEGAVQTSAQRTDESEAGPSEAGAVQTSAQAPGDADVSDANGAGAGEAEEAGSPKVSEIRISAQKAGSGMRVPKGYFVAPSDLVGSIRVWVPSELEWYVEMGVRVARLHLGESAPLSDCFELFLKAFLLEWEPIAGKMAKSHKVEERDEWRCQVPGCSNCSNLQVHHVEFRSHGGALEPWNEVTLCRAHHLKALHEGYIRVRGKAPEGLVWVLGVTPDRKAYQVFEGARRVRSGCVA